MDRCRRNFRQTSDDSGCDRLDFLPDVWTSPLDETRFPRDVIELVCEAMTACEAQVILIQRGHGAGDRAQRRHRVTSLKQKLLQGSAGSLLQHEGAQTTQIGNGTDNGIKVLSVRGPLG